MITVQSTLYAEQSMGEEMYQLWNRITVEEVKAYLGFFLLMGLIPLPSIYDYWSTNPIYHYSPIADRITRDRFFEIHRYLHFVDNSSLSVYGSPTYDKLGRIRPVIDHLNERFISMFNPNRDVSIDQIQGQKQHETVHAKKAHQTGFQSVG